MISSNIFASIREGVELNKVPEEDIKITESFESCFDLIRLKQSPECPIHEGTNLYLGGLSATRDESQLQIHNIRTVISMSDASIPEFDNIRYIRFPIDDSEDADLLSLLEDVCNVIDENLRSSSLLIHCNFGVSRSGSVVVA